MRLRAYSRKKRMGAFETKRDHDALKEEPFIQRKDPKYHEPLIFSSFLNIWVNLILKRDLMILGAPNNLLKYALCDVKLKV